MSTEGQKKLKKMLQDALTRQFGITMTTTQVEQVLKLKARSLANIPDRALPRIRVHARGCKVLYVTADVVDYMLRHRSDGEQPATDRLAG